MSGITGAVGPSDCGMMSSLVANATSVKQKLDQLTNQVSTGLVGNTYAGLGSGASVSLNLRPQIASMQTWQNNVDASTGRMSVAQTALTQIQSIAANFYAQLNNMEGVDSSEIDSVAANARDALGQVTEALDAQVRLYLRVRRTGYQQPTGAGLRQHTDLRLLHADQCSGCWLGDQRCCCDCKCDLRRGDVQCGGRLAVFDFPVAAVCHGADITADGAGGTESDRDRRTASQCQRYDSELPSWYDPRSTVAHQSPPALTCVTCCGRWRRSDHSAAAR